MNTRLVVYFVSTFLASLGAGVSDELTVAGWVRLVALSAAAGLASVRAFMDEAGGKAEPSPAAPVAPKPLASFDTRTDLVKLLLAFALVTGLLALAGCRSVALPPIKAKVCYTTKKGTRVCAGKDGKAIVLEAEGGNFDREAQR